MGSEEQFLVEQVRLRNKNAPPIFGGALCYWIGDGVCIRRLFVYRTANVCIWPLFFEFEMDGRKLFLSTKNQFRL